MTDADHTRPGLADAAGRAALFPARAAARAWRGRIEDAADDVLSAPEVARVVDRALAGSLPEDVARSLVRHRVLERIVAELAASGELDRLVAAALASPRTLELTDNVLASEETQRAIRHVTSSPELSRDRAADGWARRGGGRRPRLVDAFRPARRAARETPRATPSPYAGIATGARPRSGHGPRDRPLHGADGRPRTGGVARRRPRFRLDRGCVPRLQVALPLRRLLRPLLERRWPDARDATAAAAGHHPCRSSALRVALARALLRPAPLDRAALRRLRPVLFSQRRRGLADFLAGTVVVYDEPPAAGEA